MTNRPGFHDSKRDEVLARYHSGTSINRLTRDYHIHRQTIKRWVDELPLPTPAPQPPIVLTVFESIQPWEDSGEIIHMGNLGRVLQAMYCQSDEDDE